LEPVIWLGLGFSRERLRAELLIRNFLPLAELSKFLLPFAEFSYWMLPRDPDGSGGFMRRAVLFFEPLETLWVLGFTANDSLRSFRGFFGRGLGFFEVESFRPAEEFM
jgi:hypothetical protein